MNKEALEKTIARIEKNYGFSLFIRKCEKEFDVETFISFNLVRKDYSRKAVGILTELLEKKGYTRISHKERGIYLMYKKARKY